MGRNFSPVFRKVSSNRIARWQAQEPAPFGGMSNSETATAVSRSRVAESEGFEPPDLLQSTVFKTAAFDHSASSPSI